MISENILYDVARYRASIASPEGPFQITLKGMLVVLIVMSIMFSWWGCRLRNASREKAIVEALSDFGAVGERDFNGNIVRLRFQRGAKRLTDEDIKRITRLTHLWSIDLVLTDVGQRGLAELAVLRDLEVVCVDAARVTREDTMELLSNARLDVDFVTIQPNGTYAIRYFP